MIDEGNLFARRDDGGGGPRQRRAQLVVVVLSLARALSLSYANVEQHNAIRTM